MGFREYFEIVRSHVRLVLLSVVVVAAGTLVLSFLQKPLYQGVSQVLVTQQNAGLTMLDVRQPDTSYTPERDVQTQVDVIESPRIAQRVIDEVGLKTDTEGLLDRLTTSADSGTNVIQIRITASSPELAAEIANSFAKQYVDWSRESQRASIRAAAEDVERRLATAQEQIVQLEDATSRPGATAADKVKLAAVTDLYATLADNLEELRIADQLSTGAGSVLSEAEIDTEKVSPVHSRNGIIGLVMGLAFGLGAAFLIEYLDNTIKTEEEAEKLYGVPVLGFIPAEESKDGRRRLSVVLKPGGATAEAYRVLRNNIDFVNIDRNIRSLLVTSAVSSEGKSTVAASLASVLAQAGKHVALVVCDFHRPSTDEFFKLRTTIGLSDVLMGKIEPTEAIQHPNQGGPFVLAAGSLPPNPSELLGSEAMGRLMNILTEAFDWVILDSPPVLGAADSAAVARWVDGVLVVTHGGVSTRQAAKTAREMLDKVGARRVGIVLWGLKERLVEGYAIYSYGQRDDRESVGN